MINCLLYLDDANIAFERVVNIVYRLTELDEIRFRYQNKFKCIKCSKKFKTDKELKQHSKLDHEVKV